MSRRYRQRIDWYWIKNIITESLNQSGIFAGRANVAGKIERMESGIYHDNYCFRIEGEGVTPEWSEKALVLRLSTRKNNDRTNAEAVQYVRREVQTLRAVKASGFKYQTPEVVCMVCDEGEGAAGFIETRVWGAPLTFFKKSIYEDNLLPCISQVAAAVHQLQPKLFRHLDAYPDSRIHVLKLLGGLSSEVFAQYPAAYRAREWILSRLPEKRPSVVLHGDLLPQNLICGDFKGEWRTSVVDWEFAEIGDPAYDLAIVTRGDKKVEGKKNGLKILLNAYIDAGGVEISMADVRIHELLLVIKWLWDSEETRRQGRHYGHGPDYYEQKLESVLCRAEKED